MDRKELEKHRLHRKLDIILDMASPKLARTVMFVINSGYEKFAAKSAHWFTTVKHTPKRSNSKQDGKTRKANR